MGSTFVIVATLLAACGEDPILRAAREAEEAKSSTATLAAPAGEAAPPAAGAPAPGEPARVQAPDPPPGAPVAVPAPGDKPPPGGGPAQAAEPAPGVPVEPKPAPPGAPGGGAPGAPQGAPPKPGEAGAPPPVTGPVVTLSGTVSYPAWKHGQVRVDIFDGDHTVHGTHPGVIASQKLDRPGAFSVAVPAGAGKVYVEAVVDEDGDGRPGPQDPMGVAERYPVTVGEDAVGGLTVSLVKHEAPSGKPKGDF